ncbi:MAG: phosphotransferase [Propionibacteriales bacterium]|nr:phosphotransferase [Propionibacteriales bacterium]
MTTAPSRDLAEWLADEFALGEPIRCEPVTRGAVGALYRLDIADEPIRSYAVKQFLSYSPTEEAVGMEVAFRDACARAGVPSPAPLRSRTGAVLVGDQGIGTRYRLYEWVDGPAGRDGDADSMIILAGWMGVMHGLQVPVPPQMSIPAWYLRVEADWPELARRVRAGRLPDAERLSALLPQIIERTTLANHSATRDAIWCHRDLQPANMINNPAGPVLVDWDNSGPLVPLQELGGLLLSVGDDIDLARELVAAHRAGGATARITGPDCFATGLASILNFLSEQLEVQLDPTAPEHHDFAAATVARIVRTLPTVAQLADLAQALADADS